MRRTATYLDRNRDVADALFPVLEHPGPVFFDVDEHLLERVLPEVRRLARPRWFLPGFSWFKDETADWRVSDSKEPPPALGFLTVCAFAARGAHSGEHYAERLSALLQIRGVRLVEPYLQVEEELWRSLHIWLTRNSGMRGLAPTFVIGTDRAWGRAKAHTLLSNDQREALHGFFYTRDLLPGTQVFPPALGALFEEWLVSNGHVARGLGALWSDDDARHHLLQVIADILETWDGRLPESMEPRLRLTLDHFGSRGAVGLGLMVQTPDPRSRYVRATIGGEERSVSLAARRPGALVAPPQYRVFTTEELLTGPVTLHDGDREPLHREPHDVMMFREDPSSGAWLEMDGPRMGEAVKILAAEEAPAPPIMDGLAEELPGLPEGWVLIEGIAQTADAEGTIEFAGGLRIPMPPGVPAHFHVSFPLGIAASAGGEAFSLKVHRDPRGGAVTVGETRTSEGEPVHVDFRGETPGLYRVTLRSAHSELSREFWLVGAGTETGGGWAPGTIRFDVTDPLFALGRGRPGVGGAEPAFTGAWNHEQMGLPAQPWWETGGSRTKGRGQPGAGSSIDWDELWGILVSVEGGNEGVMRRILNQFDTSERFFHEAVRKFDNLGHIEIRRHLHTGEILTWTTNPTSVLDLGDHRRFVGHWVPQNLQALEHAGIEIHREPVENGPTLITTAATVAQLEDAAPGNVYVDAPLAALADLLPPLSWAIENIPPGPLPDDLGWDRFDPRSGAWVHVPAVEAPGAYRTGGYRSVYFLVDEDGVKHQQGRMLDPHMAKHGAVLLEADVLPLLAYCEERQELMVPVATLLPGMYGRLATLASGRPRYRRSLPGGGRCFAYGGVTPEIASKLGALFSATG